MARERLGGNLSLSRVRCLRGRHRDEMADAMDRGPHPERTPNFSFSPKKPSGVALQLTVVTMHTTAPSSVVAPVKDAHAASVVPNARAAHETTAVHLLSSHGQ